ncbi:hypothetical protein NECAME_17989 [Necator americanus]|uniref:Uncharacterized protein n=1 Tax=Necator americanus TaxID=51031 RepID=W2THZ2_NECAM|nr:hypothetical protein NECAME_17989 [Necator americanus]ETN80647.1 hypothetical protein NECAME_17989 [Necator americanus]
MFEALEDIFILLKLRRKTGLAGHNAPAFLGFETQDLSNIAYGDVHVPSIALKDIPVQREQLSVTLNRELQLIAGEFMEHQVQSDSHLSYLCQCAALNRGGLTPTTTVHIATHR